MHPSGKSPDWWVKGFVECFAKAFPPMLPAASRCTSIDTRSPGGPDRGVAAARSSIPIAPSPWGSADLGGASGAQARRRRLRILGPQHCAQLLEPAGLPGGGDLRQEPKGVRSRSEERRVGKECRERGARRAQKNTRVTQSEW